MLQSTNDSRIQEVLPGVQKNNMFNQTKIGGFGAKAGNIQQTQMRQTMFNGGQNQNFMNKMRSSNGGNKFHPQSYNQYD